MQMVSSGTSESQRLTFGNSPGGTFTLSYGNLSSDPITYVGPNEVQVITRNADGNRVFSFNGANATQINVTAATTAAQILANLNTISALNGRLTVTGPNGGPWRISFGGSLLNTNVPQIGVNNSTSTVTTVTEGGSLTNLQSNIQTGLNQILGTGNAQVTAVNTTTVDIGFVGQLANVNTQQLVASGMSNSGNALITTTTEGIGNAVQYLRLGGSGGSPIDTVTLTYNGVSTAPLQYTPGISPTQNDVLTQLNLIPSTERQRLGDWRGWRTVFHRLWRLSEERARVSLQRDDHG